MTTPARVSLPEEADGRGKTSIGSLFALGCAVESTTGIMDYEVLDTFIVPCCRGALMCTSHGQQCVWIIICHGGG